MADAKGTQFRIHPGFAVPFGEIELPEAARLNAELRALFLSREQEPYRNPDPSMSSYLRDRVFESNFDLFHWTEPCVVALRGFCNNALFRMVGELSGYGPEQIRELRLSVDAWFHVTRAGGMFGLHNHPMASWSGVYCVDSGYPGEPESGDLVFLHPASTSNMFLDLGTANLRAPWAIKPKSYRLRAGQLVLFPSWVLHHVLPYTGPGERITVAFNVWFSKATPAQAA